MKFLALAIGKYWTNLNIYYLKCKQIPVTGFLWISPALLPISLAFNLPNSAQEKGKLKVLSSFYLQIFFNWLICHEENDFTVAAVRTSDDDRQSYCVSFTDSFVTIIIIIMRYELPIPFVLFSECCYWCLYFTMCKSNLSRLF